MLYEKQKDAYRAGPSIDCGLIEGLTHDWSSSLIVSTPLCASVLKKPSPPLASAPPFIGPSARPNLMLTQPMQRPVVGRDSPPLPPAPQALQSPTTPSTSCSVRLFNPTIRNSEPFPVSRCTPETNQ
ncbi:hypothetical protein CCH79_00008670 [Gambusia affinis]|uniref:Uncharacterized protein n=1 Tax=Gambusia affinis TaxID=33528 RepID=A0A315V8G5_GAMAF|nr:hypothetical protein CCH79_00008670 [Gambusia affinis]